MKVLINKLSSVLQSKANTVSLENELVELQKNMDEVKKNKILTVNRWKNHAQKLKMKRWLFICELKFNAVIVHTDIVIIIEDKNLI